MSHAVIDYRNLFALDRKVALVSGGSRGIGEEIVRALASAGASVMLTDILADEGHALAKDLRGRGLRAEFMRQDVADEVQWEMAVAAVVAKFGGLDILVNNAGIEKQSLIADLCFEDLQKVLDINISGVLLGCKHAVRAMRPGGIAGKGGSIINISSIAGLGGIPALSAYTASKGAVRLLTKSVAVECAQLRTAIRCNSIHPGLIDTQMAARFLQGFVDLKLAESVQASKEAFLNQVPMGELGRPQDIAAAVVYLASDAARYVTGAELHVDGGYYAM
ncbi:glucose 1-dehydrogenase [Nevskia soli]|uniref:glucose 1-dehydrogenase n=1 Tax=Nevskia soli TaxID=418856 RepID=UPI0004A71105|nr:glucose 1-dehydrogenase [Nevskia soli]